MRARELDPSFARSGPLLLLALLYHKAPAWPIGPELAGEEDVIEALFTEAIGLSPHCTENCVAFAEFLKDVDREREALAFAQRARALLKTDECLKPFEREDLRRRVAAVLAEEHALRRAKPSSLPHVHSPR